jgi:hypothetical protein
MKEHGNGVSLMGPPEPSKLTVAGFLALMGLLTLAWIAFLAWSALSFLR